MMTKKYQHILLIDDDGIANFINQKLLSDWKLADHIESMTNPREALQQLEHHRGTHELPDLIFLDLNMPAFDGFDFLKHFKLLPAPMVDQIQIVVLTSSTDARDIERVKELGFNDFISKPLTLEKLSTVI